MTSVDYNKAIVNQTNDTIVLIDPAQKVLAYNAAMQKSTSTRFSKAIQIGADYREFIPAALKEVYFDSFEKAILGESILIEAETIDFLGTHWFQYKMNSIFSDRRVLIGVCLTITNIDEKKRLDRILANSTHDISKEQDSPNFFTESDKCLLNVMQNFQLSISLSRRDNSIKFLNKQFEAAFGYNLQDLPNIEQWWLLAFPDKDYRERAKKDWFARIEQSRLNKGEFEPYDCIVRCKDGTMRNIEFRYIELSDEYLVIFNDITERKKSEVKLKEYMYFFENSIEFLTVSNLDGHFEIINPEFVATSEYTEAELLNRPYFDFVHPDDLKRAHEEVEKLANGIPTTSFEFRFRTKSGTYFWMELSIKPNPSNGKLYTIGRNITERKLIEAELLENRTKMALFIEHSPAALAMVDADMRYIATSQRWINDYDLIGKTLTGKSHYEIFPEIGKEWKDIHQRCLTGVSDKREEDSFIRANGTKDWIRWEIHPWYKASGEVGGLMLFTEAITERKNAEAKLLESENRFRMVLENSLSASYKRNLITNEYNYLSPVFNKITGYSKEEMSAMTLEEVLSLMHPDDVSAVQNGIADALQESTKRENCLEYRFRHKTDGNYRWLHDEFVVIRNEEGEGISLIGCVSDVTDQKDANAKVQESEEKFRKIVESAANPILIVDQKMKITMINPEVKNVFGYSEEELLGQSIQMLIPERFRENHYRHQKEFMENSAPIRMGRNRYTPARKKNGEEIIIEASLNSFELNNEKQVLVILQDITERLKNEQRIKRANHELGLQNAVNDLIVHADSEEALLQSVCEKLVDVGFYSLASICRQPEANNGTNKFRTLGIAGKAEFLERLKELLAIGAITEEILGRVFETGKSHVVDDFDTDEIQTAVRFVANEFEIKSVCAIPIIVSGATTSVLHIYGDSSVLFDVPEVEVLERLAANLSRAISNMRIGQEMKIASRELNEEQQQSLKFQLRLLSSQLNPHFVYNVLNSFQYYILNGNVQESLDHIADFSKLMRLVLENSMNQYISLEDEIKFLEQYIRISKHRMKQEVRFKISIQKGMNPDEYLIPPMLIQPYIENALVHGLNESIVNPVITISFLLKKEVIRCQIEDNGIGRTGAAQLKNKGVKLNRKSYAININQDRIDLLNKINNQSYHVEIEDLFDDSKKPSGTRVNVLYKLIKEEF